jgi:arylsulfatase A-like enzyme/Flp pilus assembly protein TadD
MSVLFSVAAKAANKPNIILITLGSTRADHVGFLDAKHTTPSLDVLAKQSIVFERAYAQAPLTVVSIASILSGTYPQTHGTEELGSPLATSIPYLPDLLHARGYRTAAFVGSIMLDPRNGFAPGFDRGFDLYDAGFHQPQPGEGRYQSVARRADQVITHAMQWLSKKPRGPFFLWVHLDDPDGSSTSSYQRAVTESDAAVGKLLGTLRTLKLYDDSIMVLASDHGESLGAHGEDTHGIFLYDETIRVPLLLKLPQNQLGGKRVQGRVRLLDVAPSVLEAAALPVPSQMQGQSLLRVAKANFDSGQPVYARSDFPQQAFGWSVLESWRAGKYLYIRAPQPELYDLSTDPSAMHNLAQSAKATLQTVADQLRAFDGHFGSEAGKSEPSGLTSSEMQKLASLGYVGLQKSKPSADTSVQGMDPKDSIAIANQALNGWRMLDDGRPEKAALALQPVVAAQPGAFLPQYALGISLARQQKFPEAIEHLHKAIELQPDSAWAHYAIGYSLFKTGDFGTAAIHLEIASRRMPECAELHSTLAQIYDRLGRTQDAARERAQASH